MLEFTRDSQSDIAYDVAERESERVVSPAVNTSVFEAELKAAMELQRVKANKDKIRWNTSFNLPASDFTVSTLESSSSGSGSESPANFVAPPAWWTQMVIDQQSGSASSSSVSTSSSSSSSSGSASAIDLGWTTADPNNASVWKGPGEWKGWESNQKGFHSANLPGSVVETTVVDVVPTPAPVVVEPVVKPVKKMGHHGKTTHNTNAKNNWD